MCLLHGGGMWSDTWLVRSAGYVPANDNHVRLAWWPEADAVVMRTLYGAEELLLPYCLEGVNWWADGGTVLIDWGGVMPGGAVG